MMRKTLFAAVLLSAALLGPGVQAQARVAIINLKSVFDGYYKTKESDKLVKDRQTDYQTKRDRMLDSYKEANETFKKLNDSASDPAASTEEQARRRKEAEGKLLEIREIEQSISNFDKQFQSEVADQINRMRQNILRDIQEIVDAKARQAGVNLVIDTAAESVNRTPIVLFNSGLTDMTQPVLTELNRTAPAGFTPPATTGN